MNLLHVIADMDPAKGGVCQAVRTMIAGLAALGVHSEVVSLDAPGQGFLAGEPFTVHALGPGKGPWHYSSRLLPWLREQLPRFDKVLVHGLWLYPGVAVRTALAALAARPESPAAPLPQLFVMPHGMLDPYFQLAAGRRWKALRNRLYWWLLENRLVRQAEALLFTCEAELLLARQPFRPYTPRREQVVGLGVSEPPAYQPAMRQAFVAQCPGLGSRPYLLFLGRIDEKKGVDLLLEAYANCLRKLAAAARATATATGGGRGAGEVGSSSLRPAPLPALVVAGPGLDTSFGQALRARVSASEWPKEWVLFPDMLTGDAKWGALHDCEAFVLPSHQENFGIAVVEALACGKPVLISNQVNIWNHIEAAGAGMVAADSLAGTQCLLESWLRLSEPEKTAMGQRARSTYRQHFAVGPAAQRIYAAIRPDSGST